MGLKCCDCDPSAEWHDFLFLLGMRTLISPFIDRKDAALQLAELLEQYKGTTAMVLGIPKGGIEIAYHLAHQLQLQWSVLVSNKIPHTDASEIAIGAVCEEGSVFRNHPDSFAEPRVSQHIVRLHEEIKQQVKQYRQGLPLPYMRHRTVILVDDGIDTGETMAAAVMLCQKHRAGKIVVAVPTAAPRFSTKLYEATELYILQRPEPFRAVSQSYERFTPLEDDLLLHLIKEDNNHFIKH